MGGQQTFASMAWNAKGKVTQREQFLAEMDALLDWAIVLSKPVLHLTVQRSTWPRRA